MKAYDIALFMIFLMLSINIITASRVMGDGVDIYFGQEAALLNSSVQGTGVTPQTDEALSYPELAISSFGLLVRSLVVIILIFAYSTFLLPIFLAQLNLPAEVNLAITIVVWISYIVGYAQYRARSTLQGTE